MPAPSSKSPEPARYIVSASCTAATRRSPSPHHSSICFAAHSGQRSSWQMVHAFGMPNCAVFSGTGGGNVRNSQRRVKQILQDVGVRDPSHFCRDFKSRFGLTPTQYRRFAIELSQTRGSANE